jgi:hypothetical protein
MLRSVKCVLVLAAAVWASRVAAEDAYYYVPLDKLELTEGSLPKGGEDLGMFYYEYWQFLYPYAILDGDGEAYVFDLASLRYLTPWDASRERGATPHISVTAPAGKAVTGRLYLQKPSSFTDTLGFGRSTKFGGFEILKFKIPAATADKDAKSKFLQDKMVFYQQLLSQNLPGGAWFRHQVRLAQIALGNKPTEEIGRTPTILFPRANEIDSTYDLFTGGRAISENLQIERIMAVPQPGEETVDINKLEGITTKEIDWKPLLKDASPKLDPLADAVPFDQHVVFFPSFENFLKLSDESKNIQGLFFKMAEAKTDDASTNALYEKQLCLTVSGLSRLLGPKMVKSVALTGSDPYFFTGTDVAVVFESPEPAVLEKLILAQVTMRASARKDAKPVDGQAGGASYKGFRSPDRGLSTYIAKVQNAVVVANSPHQIERLAGVAKGETKPISSLDEYKFFRTRYVLGDKEETAFFFLSDATIRRWCGPRWRIGTSRRIQDAAVLAELQASNFDKLVSVKVETGPIYTDLPMAEKGELLLTPTGVASSKIGTFDFMTPIAELPIDRATKAEADAYNRWRDGYQRNWRWAFDPIALRLGVDKKKLSADLTVMPMILGTEYREFVAISQGVKFPSDAADPHNALGQFVIAINKDASRVRSGTNLLNMMTPGAKLDALGWLGNYVSIYADDDPFWDELAKVQPEDIQKFMQKNVGKVPVALYADVSSGFKLTAFLVALRAFVSQSAPDMTNWETLTYKDQSYVKITPTEHARSNEETIENLAVYYVASGDCLIVTLNEALLKRSIDRRLVREEAKKKGDKLPEAEHPWLGENMALAVNGKLIQLIAAMTQYRRPSEMQIESWKNLAILNEWKRRYPNQDPVELASKFWHLDVRCPGGGKYVWNEKYQTMESTVYGHPGEPKEGPTLRPYYQFLKRGDFGINFEEQGIRAKAMLNRQ